MDRNGFDFKCAVIVRFIQDYMKSLPDRRIMARQRDTYLRDVIPKTAPEKPLDFHSVMKVVQDHLLPGLVQWRHPRYFGYLPNGGSYLSILANMLASAVNGPGFSWSASPAMAELESITLDWLCKMLGLPELFLSFACEHQCGGGALQLSAADATLMAVLAARHRKLHDVKKANPGVDRRIYLPKLVAYCSILSQGNVERSAELAMVKVRLLEVDGKHRLRGETLQKAVQADIEKGLMPFYLWASLGSNACCACDVIGELGPVCERYNLWMHVDASYAGSALVCPEFRHFLEGVDFADSFCVDPSLWMLANFDCCALWVQNRKMFVETFMVDPMYLEHEFSDQSSDLRHWSLPLSRRFRSLKLWFIIRYYGVEGLQKHIRNHVRLARLFESLVLEDERFVLVNEVHFGVVCFRLVGCNDLNVALVSAVNRAGKIFLVGNMVGDEFAVRFCVCNENAKDEDVEHAWRAIVEAADRELLDHDKTLHECK